MKSLYLTKTQTFHSWVVEWLYGLVSKLLVQKELFYSNKEELENLGATVYLESPVTNIDYDAKTVTALVNGQEHVESFDKLLFATGSQPILPPIKGAEIKEGSLEFEATLSKLAIC